jgi:ADP-dependent NAD(P)H-hydrate dehydratase
MDAATARFELPVLLTPHAGEMARLSGVDKDTVCRDAALLAQQSAQRLNAVVALKGATTWIATRDRRLWRHDGGNVGLATSGSGDTLAGITCGLAARGASLEQAAVWGVALHARAGDALARRLGPLGYIASELLAEVPALMHALGQPE